MKLKIPIQCIERLFCAFTMAAFAPKLNSNISENYVRSFSVPLIKESNAGRRVHKIKESVLKNRLPSIPGISSFQAERLTRQQSASKQH